MKIAIAALLLLTITDAQAACTCTCVDGKMQPLCDSAFEIAPRCIGLCRAAVPSLGGRRPTVPPFGTSTCKPAQVCDRDGCRTEMVCR